MTRLVFLGGGGGGWGVGWWGVAELLKSENQPDYPYRNQLRFINIDFNVKVLTAVKMYIMS